MTMQPGAALRTAALLALAASLILQSSAADSAHLCCGVTCKSMPVSSSVLQPQRVATLCVDVPHKSWPAFRWCAAMLTTSWLSPAPISSTASPCCCCVSAHAGPVAVA